MDLFVKIGICITFLLACSVFALVLMHGETKKLKINKINLRDGDDIKSTPVKICLISDLHFPNFYLNQDSVIDTICKESLDGIFVAGDLIQNKKGLKNMLAFLAKLSEAAGNTKIFIVLGNHDNSGYKEANSRQNYKKEIKKCGDNIVLLENEVKSLKIPHTKSKIVVVGLGDTRTTEPFTMKNVYAEALDETEEEDALVVLAHNPDTALQLKDQFEKSQRHNVLLCGHTHGGQVWMPFNFEFAILRKDKMPKKGYIYGKYSDFCKNCTIYITCGLGESLMPIRLGTRPEIVFIDY